MEVDPFTNPVAQTGFMKRFGLRGKVFCTYQAPHGYVALEHWPEASIYIDPSESAYLISRFAGGLRYSAS